MTSSGVWVLSSTSSRLECCTPILISTANLRVSVLNLANPTAILGIPPRVNPSFR